MKIVEPLDDAKSLTLSRNDEESLDNDVSLYLKMKKDGKTPKLARCYGDATFNPRCGFDFSVNRQGPLYETVFKVLAKLMKDNDANSIDFQGDVFLDTSSAIPAYRVQGNIIGSNGSNIVLETSIKFAFPR